MNLKNLLKTVKSFILKIKRFKYFIVKNTTINYFLVIQISDKFYDKAFKLQSIKHFESLCFNCGIFIEFDHFINSELVDDGGTTYHMDIAFVDRRGFIAIVEFQSSVVTEDDVDRFMKYAVLTHLREGKNVHIYVISTVEEQDRVIRRKWNLFNEFTIYIKSLKSIDGNKTLNRIKQRIKNNEVNNEDIADLETIIFMKSDKSVVELLWEIATLVNCIENMDGNELYDLKMFLEMYVRKFVDDEYEAQKLMELIEMKKDLYHRTVDTIMSRGEAKIINNLLENGFTLDEICAMVNLEKNYVLNLLK